MLKVCSQRILHEEQIDNVGAANVKNQGTLKADKEYLVFVLSNSETATEGVFEFLQEINQQERSCEQLLNYLFFPITENFIEIGTKIRELLQELAKDAPLKDEPDQNQKQVMDSKDQAKPSQMQRSETVQRSPQEASIRTNPQVVHSTPEKVYSSLFALARSFNTSLTQARQKKEGEHKEKGVNEKREENKLLFQLPSDMKVEHKQLQERHYEREGNGKQEQGKQGEEKEGFSQNQDKSKQSNKKNKIFSIQTARSVKSQNLKSNKQAVQKEGAQGTLGGVENIYIRFMALMARILGQAELEAHQLYQRIKERTDAIDALTLLISKINSEKGEVDWSKNEEMKQLIDKARALGVDIPEGKYKWSEEEKKLLKENVTMRKDSMEKMTQLERTDMQRYLQEASQCHQARSNVLKLLKEVIDTFIHNIRPS